MLTSFLSVYYLLAVAQMSGPATPAAGTATMPTTNAAAPTTPSSTSRPPESVQPIGTSGKAITLTLDQVVNLAVGNNTNVILAKQRYAESLEDIAQIKAAGVPQINSVIADTYSTFAESSGDYSVLVTNPTLPGGSVVPTITDEAASFPSSFGLGTISNANGSSGAGTISSATGTSLTLPASGATTLPSPTSGSTTSTALPGVGTGSTTPGTTTTTPGTDGSTTTTTTPGSTGTTPGSTSSGTDSSTSAPSTIGASFDLTPMPSILQDFVTETGAPSVIVSSAGDNASLSETHSPSPSSETAMVSKQELKSAPDQGTGGGSTTTTTSDGATTAIGKTSVNNYGGRLYLSQYIDAFGVLSAEKSAERLTSDFYAIDIDRTENEVALSAKNLYFNVILAQENVATDQEAVNDAEESVRVTNALVQQGQAAGFDLLSAQTTLANDQQVLSAAQDNYSFAVADLDYLLGVSPNTPLILTVPPLPSLNQKISLQQSTAVALQRRPEILQANQNVSLAQKLAKVASSGTTPTLGLVGEYGYNSINSASGPRNEGLFSAQVAIPIDDGGATRSRVRQANDVLRSQITTRNEEQLNVQLEVRQAYLNILEGQSSATTDQTAVALAVETLRVANVQYQNGVGTILDVENAQAQLATARTNLANAQFTYETALAALVRDIGSR